VEKRPTTQRTSTGATLSTITSKVNDKYYAVLPHGVTLPGWTEEEKLELNDHVRHMMHSKRSKFKRGMRGFGQYIRKRESLPIWYLLNSNNGRYLALGLFVTVYATLITLFGLIWVLFLIGKPPPPPHWDERSSYCIKRMDQRRRSPRLHNKRNRQCARRPLRHHR
jgi:hypothetical protein